MGYDVRLHEPPHSRNESLSQAACGQSRGWYPWGDEALGRAKLGEQADFLSIGYSACHWCHVMERESLKTRTSQADERTFIEHQGGS